MISAVSEHSAIRRAVALLHCVFAVVVLAACTLDSDAKPDSSPARSSLDAPRVAEAEQAIEEFISAFNAGDHERALSFFTKDPSVGASDCDYRLGKSRLFRGPEELESWLMDRAADHDRLTLGDVRMIFDEGSLVAAVVNYRRRTSDTLTELGLREGIRPSNASKIPFTRRGPVRFTQFANAGNDVVCRVRSLRA